MTSLLPPKKYLFLDIDGVLLPFGNSKSSSTQFPKSTLHAFNHILSSVSKVEIVLSSTWRCGGGQTPILKQFLASNLSPLSSFMTEFQYTTDLNQHDHRQWEINNWLKQNVKPNDTWVVLDDEECIEGEFNAEHRSKFLHHVIKTDSSLGLQWHEAKLAISILNNEIAIPSLPIILSAQKPAKGTCRHWWKRGSCRMGDACVFQHPPHDTLPPVPRRKYRQQVSNAGRFRQFREWVVNKFNLEQLQKHGVLCIADGKGILSFELYNIHDVPTTVIDPRPLSLERSMKLWYRGLYHKKSYKNITRYVPSRVQTEHPCLPYHVRAFFLPEFWENKTETVFQDNLHRAEQTIWTKQGLQDASIVTHEIVYPDKDVKVKEGIETSSSTARAATPTTAPTTAPTKKQKTAPILPSSSSTTATIIEQQFETKNENGINESTLVVPDTTVRQHLQAMELVSKSCLVLGMHPDQAACPIVEYAIKYHKSFAVVPCCVYSNEIKRKLKNGQWVKSYDDLCTYLKELSPDIESCIVPYLEGKNQCIYRILENETDE